MLTDAPVAPTGLFGFINPSGLYDPSANGYSHVAVVRLPARVIHIAGQGGETVDGALSPRFEVQVAQALDNLSLALASAGATLADVAKLTVLVVDHDQDRLGILSDQIGRRWPVGRAPTCTLIPVPRLALDGMLFEIEATAYTA